MKRIENKLLAPGSVYRDKLVRFVRGDQSFPTTDGPLGGLPFVVARATSTAQSDRPTLLFLNLPVSPEPQYPLSTADDALNRARRPETLLLPLFGVSGCGKTRTAIEMLCKNWGFYFNASITDWGSRDLSDLLVSVQQMQQYQNRDLNSNTQVHLLALALVLGRVITLEHCLDIAEHEKTIFAHKDWMLMQVACRTLGFDDLLTELSTLLANMIRLHNVNINVMRDFVQTRFSELRQRLLHLAPNQDMGERILLVIDEAQNLGKYDYGAFLSQRRPIGSQEQDTSGDIMRPVLSPFVHGLYQSLAATGQFCVVPCGTGLSIHELGWLQDSAPVTKDYEDQVRPFTTFKGWSSLEQVQDYLALVRSLFPDEQARRTFDTRVPDEAVSELFARLRGRFRPIVTAIGKDVRRVTDASI